jgi:cytoskeletal protein CcmA (bactofilin family)
MWKKEESSKQPPFGGDIPETKAASFTSGPPAVIGPSLVIDGSISGGEDLLIEGHVKGDISLPENVVTVGTSGKVEARIHAAVVVVEGRVKGDLVGEEQIEIRRSGNANGNIVAPRVGLEDGAQFKGNIDMTPKKKVAPSTPAPAVGVSVPGKEKHDRPAGKDSNPKFSG